MCGALYKKKKLTKLKIDKHTGERSFSSQNEMDHVTIRVDFPFNSEGHPVNNSSQGSLSFFQS